MTLTLFFSYSHKDEDLRDQLEVHLTMLKRQGLIDAWHDRRLLAGDHLDHSIKAELERADIILFLASPDFIASQYCYDVEVARAMQRHDAGQARVIPVILRPCEWQQTPFGKLLGTPRDNKPVTRWPDRDEAFQDVVRAVRKAAEAMAKTMPAPDRPAPLATMAQMTPRSSNLRITKRYTEQDRADFLLDSFAFLEKFVQGSLAELDTRNPDISTRFRKIDANRFTATAYRDGKLTSACTLYLADRDIRYRMSADQTTNSYNEAVHVEADDQAMYLKAMGMAYHATGGRDAHLTAEGAAEMFWSLFIGSLQDRA